MSDRTNLPGGGRVAGGNVAGMALNDLRYVLLTATDEEVGPTCMNVPVPPTIADDEGFREVYTQGWRHALAAARRALDSDEKA